MIYIFTQLSVKFKHLDVIASSQELVKPDDWAVIMDADTMLLHPDFGHNISRANEDLDNSETGLITTS